MFCSFVLVLLISSAPTNAGTADLPLVRIARLSVQPVTDELAEGLRVVLGDEAFVELTMMVAVENQRSRLNSALGLTSQGFKDRCELGR